MSESPARSPASLIDTRDDFNSEMSSGKDSGKDAFEDLDYQEPLCSSGQQGQENLLTSVKHG